MEKPKVEKVVKPKVEKVVFDHAKEYSFKSNGKSKHMPKDAIYSVNGSTAEILVNKGYGECQ